MPVSLPPVNAQVTLVRGSGTSDDYDRPGAPGPVKWEGSAPAHLSERTHTETGAGRVDLHIVTRLVVPSALPVAPEDDVTYVKGAVTATRRVLDLEERSDFGFVRLYFHDQ